MPDPQKHLVLCVMFASFGCIVSMGAAASRNSYDLFPDSAPHQQQRVQVQLEVRGELRMNPDGKGTRSEPLEVEARLRYHEQLRELAEEPWKRRAARLYEEAFASIRVGGALVNRRLPAEQSLILVTAEPGDQRLFSPYQPLRREELDLLDVQASSVLVDRLLPRNPVELEERWVVEPRGLAVVFSLDAVHEADVEGRLVGVEESTARIEWTGTIQGSAGGVGADLAVRARGNFDLQRRRLTWFAVSMRETRAIGHAQPGFEVTARLQMTLRPGTQDEVFAEQQLAGLAWEEPNSRLLRYEPARSHYRLLADRRWRAMIDRHDLSVLRLVDRGELVAQCNISELPAADPGQHLALEAFQTQIRQTLGEQFGQFVAATQEGESGGRRVLRVAVAGLASGIPIQWVYYHISAPDGRQVAFAFTLESHEVDRLGTLDREMIESFEFLPRPEAPRAARRASPTRTTPETELL